MTEQRVTPKFLSREVAERAVEAALKATVHNSDMQSMLSRPMCHVVVWVPSMPSGQADNTTNGPKSELAPHCLYERSVGEVAQWPRDFAAIARSKALQLWQDRNDNGTDVMPHLLFPGDVAFWGGVKRHGIVVACSGVQAYFDRMIAGIIADLCVGLAYHAWMTSREKKEGSLFLG